MNCLAIVLDILRTAKAGGVSPRYCRKSANQNNTRLGQRLFVGDHTPIPLYCPARTKPQIQTLYFGPLELTA